MERSPTMASVDGADPRGPSAQRLNQNQSHNRMPVDVGQGPAVPHNSASGAHQSHHRLSANPDHKGQCPKPSPCKGTREQPPPRQPQPPSLANKRELPIGTPVHNGRTRRSTSAKHQATSVPSALSAPQSGHSRPIVAARPFVYEHAPSGTASPNKVGVCTGLADAEHPRASQTPAASGQARPQRSNQ